MIVSCLIIAPLLSRGMIMGCYCWLGQGALFWRVDEYKVSMAVNKSVGRSVAPE